MNARTATLALLLMFVLVPGWAYAYIDPGTTQSLFAVLAPLIAIFGLFIGYLLWPFRKVLGSFFRRGDTEDDEAEAEDAPPADADEQQT
jgi:hypothetical protein